MNVCELSSSIEPETSSPTASLPKNCYLFENLTPNETPMEMLFHVWIQLEFGLFVLDCMYSRS